MPGVLSRFVKATCTFVLAAVAGVHGQVLNASLPIEQPSANLGAMSCVQQVGGITWDLSSLKGTDLTGKSGDRYGYIMNPCGAAGGICAGNTNEPMICQSSPTGGLEAVIGYGGDRKTPPPAWDLVDPSTPSKGVKLTFRNGDFCYDGPSNIRTAIVSFICDSAAGNRPSTFEISESPVCTFNVVYRNGVSCPGGGGGGSSGGMSGGSVFLLLLFIFLILYIGLGCFYKRKKMGTTGMRESCPNYDFWASIPGYVKEGILYTRRKISGMSRGGSGGAQKSYDQL